MELNAREFSWDGYVNARDLGGLGKIRPGAVVRTEAPRRLTEREPEREQRPTGITTVHAPVDPVGTPFYEHWKGIDNLCLTVVLPGDAGRARIGPGCWPSCFSRWPGRPRK